MWCAQDRDTSQTGQCADRTFRRQDSLTTGYFADRTVGHYNEELYYSQDKVEENITKTITSEYTINFRLVCTITGAPIYIQVLGARYTLAYSCKTTL